MKIQLQRPVLKDFPISSKFGLRVLNGKEDFHKGVDFAVPVGTPVRAAIDGHVHRAGWENEHDPKQGFGLRVMQAVRIDGLLHWVFYGHLNTLKVTDGDDLKIGQIVGYSGNTGKTTGPHLHMGCRKSDTNEWLDMEFSTPPPPAKLEIA